MKGFIFTAPALLLLLLSGCGKGYEGQTETKAPKTALEIADSLIAAGVSEPEVSALMENNPQAKVRVLGNDTFEFRGLQKRQILEVSPSAIVEQNSFIKINSNSVTKEQLLNKALQSDISNEFAPQNCTENSLLRVPAIKVSNNNLNSSLNVNEKIELSFATPFYEGLTAWYIVPPMGSDINIQFEDKKNLEFTPDMPGGYGVALFFKRDGLCNVSFQEMTVTLNEPFIPTLSTQDQLGLKALSTQDFKQVSITKADKARELLTRKTDIVVAVLDSGVNYNHPALKSSMWVNTKEIDGDGIDNDSNGYIDDVVGFDFENHDGMPMDDAGHGSHVAGLIAGEYMGTGNKSGIQIMALKAGSSMGLELGAIVKGINYAVENGADIINMSFGGPRQSAIVKASIQKASEAGVLVVAASGNGDQRGLGVDNDDVPQFPASYDLPNILAVGSAKADGSLTQYSNYGKTQVDLVAVGGHADRFERTANLLKSVYLVNPNNILTQPMAGTSMAAPVIAGIAALAMSESPNLDPSQVRQLLMKTGIKSPFLSNMIVSESTVDAQAAIMSLQNLF
ncbi:MAG: S8 family peptidase [Bdellovibrionales bacterium]